MSIKCNLLQELFIRAVTMAENLTGMYCVEY